MISFQALSTCLIVEVGDIGRPIGRLTDDQEIALAHALATAYDLNIG